MKTEKKDIIRASKLFSSYKTEELKEIVSFLAVQAEYEGELTVLELTEKIRNINNDNFKKEDFYKVIMKQNQSTPFGLIFITMMYWAEVNNVDLKDVNDSFLELNNKVKSKIHSKLVELPNKEEVLKTLDLSPMSKFDTWMPFVVYYNPDNNTINRIDNDEIVLNLQSNKNILKEINEDYIEYFVSHILEVMNITHSVDFAKNISNSMVTYDELLELNKEDFLSKNIIKLLNSYPCITKDEVVEILINNYTNKQIIKYLKRNTSNHEKSLIIWDEEQYIEDSQSLKMRKKLINRKSNSYKDLDIVNGVLTADTISNKIEELINSNVLIYINPVDEFEPPYIMERHISKEYLALKTSDILKELYEKEDECAKLCEESIFAQFLK